VPPTRILLARHGETEWNSVGRWQGHADPPLNETGRLQAAALAAQLEGNGIAAVYASDLARAAETARTIAARLGLDVFEDPALREIDVGSWSGLTRAEVEQRFPEGFARWLDGEIGHDGETREALTERVVAAIERIAARHEGRTVLVVTHGGAIRALRRHAAGEPGEPVLNCGTVGLELRDGTLVVADPSMNAGSR
jgi:broad specificity phosphatase PhoE